MAEELSYILVTPRALQKGRLGGILSRLLAWTGLTLARARVFRAGDELVQKYASLLPEGLLRDYTLAHLGDGLSLLLLFRGKEAIAKTAKVVGPIGSKSSEGATLRETFGDLSLDGETVRFFEPGVLSADDAFSTREHLALFAEYSETDGGIYAHPAAGKETSLVLIKPDNFRHPSIRPGGIIDLLSQTGLSLVGAKVHHLSVAQACEFYGPVLPALKKYFTGCVGDQVKAEIETSLQVALDPATLEGLNQHLGPLKGETHWETLVEFMCGRRPSQTPEEERETPGTQQIIALIYQGEDAVHKIRTVLGPTDPSKAPHGTIRKEFGQTMMVNAGHASDSVENAAREMGIVQIEENNLKPFIESFYGCAQTHVS